MTSPQLFAASTFGPWMFCMRMLARSALRTVKTNDADSRAQVVEHFGKSIKDVALFYPDSGQSETILVCDETNNTPEIIESGRIAVALYVKSSPSSSAFVLPTEYDFLTGEIRDIWMRGDEVSL